LIEKLNIIILI